MSNSVFPTLPGIKWDVLKIPGWSTRVQRSVGGKEQRASFWSTPIYTWQLTYELLRANALLELQSLIGFFNARQGKFDSFLFSDPTDNNVTAHGFGVGDGAKTAFQLQRTIAGPRQQDFSGTYPTSTIPRTNILQKSEAIGDNPTWLLDALATAALNAPEVPDPRGGNAASRIVSVLNNGLLQSCPAFVGSNTFTFSVWLRTLTGSIGVGMQLYDGVTFPSQNITVTSQWQRFSFTATFAGSVGTTLRSYFYLLGTGTVYAFGAQTELGPIATAYIPTTTAAVTINPSYWPAAADAFEPVLDLNGSPTIYRKQDWQGNQQLYSNGRTNDCLQSEALGTTWVPVHSTIGSNLQTAPDLAVTADKIQEDNTTNQHGVSQPITCPLGVQTFSIFVTAAERSKCVVTMSDGTTGDASIGVDLSNGSTFASGFGAGSWTNVSAKVELWAIAGGAAWYRVSVTGLRGAGTQTFCQVYTWTTSSSYAGTTGFGIYAWGGQHEFAATSTSYIKTTTAAISVTDYTLSAAGLVTFSTAPLAAAILTWTGSYYWRVRFDLDQAEFNNFLYQLWEAKKITLVSVKAA